MQHGTRDGREREFRRAILSLGHYLLERSCQANALEPKEWTQSAIDALKQHAWPGNIRELGALVDRLAILTPGSIEDRIARYDGNMTKATKDLGLERSHLYKKVKRLLQPHPRSYSRPRADERSRSALVGPVGAYGGAALAVLLQHLERHVALGIAVGWLTRSA